MIHRIHSFHLNESIFVFIFWNLIHASFVSKDTHSTTQQSVHVPCTVLSITTSPWANEQWNDIPAEKMQDDEILIYVLRLWFSVCVSYWGIWWSNRGRHVSCSYCSAFIQPNIILTMKSLDYHYFLTHFSKYVPFLNIVCETKSSISKFNLSEISGIGALAIKQYCLCNTLLNCICKWIKECVSKPQKANSFLW